MSSFLKELQQPEYVHVLLNHLPLTGLFAALLGLVGALFLKQRGALFLCLSLVCLMSLSVWPVAEFGEKGFDRVLAMSDSDGQAYLRYHAELVDRWVFIYYITAAAAAAAMFVGWKAPKYFRLAAGVVLLLGLSSLVAGGVIADCGGKIRHREFRTGPPPVVSAGEDG